ncbi:MAG: hypothetical protein SVO01_00270 [Thermotogota bacterium]|nr:hypothetical protein [Thermotogota bacterium]
MPVPQLQIPKTNYLGLLSGAEAIKGARQQRKTNLLAAQHLMSKEKRAQIIEAIDVAGKMSATVTDQESLDKARKVFSSIYGDELADLWVPIEWNEKTEKQLEDSRKFAERITGKEYTLSPGQKRLIGSQVIAEMPEEGEEYTLSPGQTRFKGEKPVAKVEDRETEKGRYKTTFKGGKVFREDTVTGKVEEVLGVEYEPKGETEKGRYKTTFKGGKVFREDTVTGKVEEVLGVEYEPETKGEMSESAVRQDLREMFNWDENKVNKAWGLFLKYTKDPHNMSRGVALKKVLDDMTVVRTGILK